MRDERGGQWRWVAAAQFVPVLIAIIFNAVMLLPELRVAVPGLNDDAFHYLYVQRADAALNDGKNPFDNWSPTLKLGEVPLIDKQASLQSFLHVPQVPRNGHLESTATILCCRSIAKATYLAAKRRLGRDPRLQCV
jgi:hypothetical protein